MTSETNGLQWNLQFPDLPKLACNNDEKKKIIIL